MPASWRRGSPRSPPTDRCAPGSARRREPRPSANSITHAWRARSFRSTKQRLAPAWAALQEPPSFEPKAERREPTADIQSALVIRVLHVYSGNLFGGIEAMLLAIARQPPSRDLESEYALCFEGRLSRELVAAGAAVHQLAEVR